MSKQIIPIIIFSLFCSFVGKAQLFKQLEKADSLAQENEFAASIELINKVLNEKPRNFLKAQAFYQLSYAYLQVYDLDKATEFNQKSLNIRDLIHYEFVADNYMRFGTIALLQKQYNTALKYFLEALNLPHEDLQFSGILEGYLGATYKNLGDTELALQHLQNSLEILEWAQGESNPDVSVAHYNLGNYYASVGDYETAINHYEKSVVIELKLKWGPEQGNARLAKTYNALGLVLFQQNREEGDILSNFEGAVLASTGLRRLTAVSRLNLAQFKFIKGDLESASKHIDLALEVLNPDEEEYPEYFIPMIIDKSLYSRGLQLKTEILLDAYYQDQQTAALQKVFDNSTFAVEVFEGRLLDFYTEKNQLELLSNSKDVYEQAVYIALKMNDITSDPKYINEAFKYAERGKAIVLKNQMQQFYEMIGNSLPDHLQKREKDIRTKLTFFETDLAVKYKADNFRKEALELSRDYESLLAEIEKSAPQYFDLRYQLPKLSIDAVQEKLENDEALLSYFQGKDLYYIFAINKTESDVFFANQNAPLTTKKKISLKMIEKKANGGFKAPDMPKMPKPDDGVYSQVIDDEMDLKTGVNKGLSGTIKVSKAKFVGANHALYRRLIEPVKPILKKKRKLIIVPHGDLHFVAFETLLKEKPKKKKVKYRKLKYLIKDYSIAYEMSADFLLNRQDTESEDGFSIAAWAPVFNPEDNLGYTLNAEDILFDSLYFEDMELRSLVPDRSTFSKLEHSEVEVNAVLNLFAKEGHKGKGFLKGDASETTFKSESANYNHLHIASHSFINAISPNLSGVALSTNNSEEDDGILFAGEVMNLDLKNTKLVVLSSCESGTGALVRGEGLLSLSRAFYFAGAESIVSTRWKITDKQSAQMMTYFYKKILDGATYSEALRYAKLKMIKKTKTATPRLWAGFKLTGGEVE